MTMTDNYLFFERKNKNDGFFDGCPSFFIAVKYDFCCGKMTVF